MHRENTLGLPVKAAKDTANTRATHASMDGRSRALLALLIATTDALQRTIRLSGKPRCAALRATGPSWAHGGVSDRAFGVEIELLSDDGVYDLADAFDRADEDVIIRNTVTRDTTKAWKIVPDLSLPAGRGFELVSPILRGANGRRRLATVMNQINDVIRDDINGRLVEALGGRCRLAAELAPAAPGGGTNVVSITPPASTCHVCVSLPLRDSM